ncbi:glycoside hydrolase family 3 C-terminal domain-containing protein [Silvibacterium acidisoli]|uniref:glycoside hydrolase family 3 C-terminal domain-containing protein n=1 Tax=Acidobacteriaceae bacterium ZG23-2 TaxID=2883246 RepID=UPI00406D015E
MPTSRRVDDLVSRMTLEEKVSQMDNGAEAIPRLGVPAYDWWNEGLHGIARSGYATVFPQAIGMAATWDTTLLGEIGTTISTEARAKYEQALRENNHSIYYGLTIWSPNINIFRDPRWGRGQETYGEDPYLTSRLGVSFVKGLQGDDSEYLKTVATPKHFAVHSGPESSRHKFNVEPSKYDLEDTYLPAFRATITEGHAESLMCAYNRIDGDPACANRVLLEEHLRKDWGFKGYVTSDCGAIDDFYEKWGHHYSPDAEHAAASALLAGTDISCGETYKTLTKAVKDGLVKESDIDVALKRLFMARFRLGMFDPADKVRYAQIPFSEDDSAEHRALALKAANESIVLLKNENHLLPLAPSVHTIAVVGPNAASIAALEGNYNAIASHPVMPIDGIRSEFKGAKVLYAEGSSYVEGLAVTVPRNALHPSAHSKEEGLKGEYFASADFSGKPALSRVDPQIDFDWNAAAPVAGTTLMSFSVRWTGTITAPAAGDIPFNFSLAGCYPCGAREAYTVYLDGKQVAQHTLEKDANSRDLPDFTLHFTDTKPHSFRVDYSHDGGRFGAGPTLNWKAPADSLRQQAIAIAKQADVVVAFVGLSPNLEGEEMPVHLEGFAGGDRTDIQLPAAQRQLLEELGATGKPLVVVLMNGSALAVNWAKEHAQAILEAWYPGEVGGQAIADTLSGKNNPSGRLPLTFYKSIDQLPAFDDYAMKGRTYRYFKGEPLFAFGYGLSYSHFTYSNLHLSKSTLQAGDTLLAEADVKNDGKIAGDEVSELYITPPASDLAPVRALKAFTRVHVAPGETEHVRFELSPRQLSTVDAAGDRAVRPGEYTIVVGGEQPTTEQPGLSEKLTIEGTKPVAR